MSASSLSRIKLSGFKSIRDMDLALGNLNVLIGSNGAGKSNFISIFRLLAAIVNGNLQRFVAESGGANSIFYFGRQVTETLRIHLEFGINLYSAELAADQLDSLFFVDEVVYLWDRQKYPEKPFDETIGRAHRESKLKSTNVKMAPHVVKALSNWRIYHFHDTGISAKVKQTADVADNIELSGDARNLAPYLLQLRRLHPSSYTQIVDTVRLAAPFFDDFLLRPRDANADKLRLEWTQKGSDALFGPNDLSDGTLRFICLATALLQPVPPATILIDEPELGLHPYAITLLAGLMQSASRRMQVIVSTQSVPLVNQFSPEDLIVVDRKGGETVFKRLDSVDLSIWLDDYGLGDLWEKNVFGGRPTYV